MSNRIQLKDEIIVHVLNFIEEREQIEKVKAARKLIELAKRYRLKPSQKPIASDNMKYLKEFIINAKGYVITISNLYNSLLNASK